MSASIKTFNRRRRVRFRSLTAQRNGPSAGDAGPCVDESGLSTKMARFRGWHQRASVAAPPFRTVIWKTVTFVGGLTLKGLTPMLLDGPMDGECFLAWVEQSRSQTAPRPDASFPRPRSPQQPAHANPCCKACPFHPPDSAAITERRSPSQTPLAVSSAWRGSCQSAGTPSTERGVRRTGSRSRTGNILR